MVTTSVKFSYEDYLNYNDDTDNRYELVRGRLNKLTPPSVRHLLIAKFIERKLDDLINRLDLPLVALREAGVQTERDSARLPDVCVVTSKEVEELFHRSAIFRLPVKLAVEIVSPSSKKTNYQEKPLEYANKGINEYWIVDPQLEKVVIFVLDHGVYQQTEFVGDNQIISPTFPELVLTPKEIFSLTNNNPNT